MQFILCSMSEISHIIKAENYVTRVSIYMENVQQKWPVEPDVAARVSGHQQIPFGTPVYRDLDRRIAPPSPDSCPGINALHLPYKSEIIFIDCT